MSREAGVARSWRRAEAGVRAKLALRAKLASRAKLALRAKLASRAKLALCAKLASRTSYEGGVVADIGDPRWTQVAGKCGWYCLFSTTSWARRSRSPTSVIFEE